MKELVCWLIVLGAVCGAMVAVGREPVGGTPAPPAPAPLQVINGRYDPLAVYDAKERELTVTEHAPRDLLLCLRGTCKLVEDWVEAGK